MLLRMLVFFVICDQQFPSVEDIERQFSVSEKFFELPDEIKAETPFVRDQNTGWESKAQVRPSTGTADQKESLQLQQHLKNVNWPTAIHGFEEQTVDFMTKARALSVVVLGFFAESLGMDKDFFDRAHDVLADDAQSTLRLLHYPALPKDSESLPKGYWRAGAHADFDCLTLLFQKTGQDGLEVCPGREATTSFAIGDRWIPVKAQTGTIVVNIGDQLMMASDDRFKSLYHRVRAPGPADYKGKRLSVAYFNQVNKGVVIQGPKKKYLATTGAEFILNAMRRNFAALQAKQQELQANA